MIQNTTPKYLVDEVMVTLGHNVTVSRNTECRLSGILHWGNIELQSGVFMHYQEEEITFGKAVVNT